MRSTHRKAPKSNNVYLKLLVRFYAFLARKFSPSSLPFTGSPDGLGTLEDGQESLQTRLPIFFGEISDGS